MVVCRRKLAIDVNYKDIRRELNFQLIMLLGSDATSNTDGVDYRKSLGTQISTLGINTSSEIAKACFI